MASPAPSLLTFDEAVGVAAEAIRATGRPVRLVMWRDLLVLPVARGLTGLRTDCNAAVTRSPAQEQAPAATHPSG